MSRRPQSDPLGATPALPAPQGGDAASVTRVFRRWVEAQEPWPPLPPSGPTRRYPIARGKLSAADKERGVDERDEARVETMSPDVEVTQTQVSPSRPPLGAPTVRAPVRRAAAQRVDQSELAHLADSALLVHAPDGSTAFEIAFDDETLPGVACRIAVANGKVTAAFHAPDRTTRWLLEGEIDRLRADLENRGLRVDAVTVDDEEA